jgi:hypothetical protein
MSLTNFGRSECLRRNGVAFYQAHQPRHFPPFYPPPNIVRLPTMGHDVLIVAGAGAVGYSVGCAGSTTLRTATIRAAGVRGPRPLWFYVSNVEVSRRTCAYSALDSSAATTSAAKLDRRTWRSGRHAQNVSRTVDPSLAIRNLDDDETTRAGAARRDNIGDYRAAATLGVLDRMGRVCNFRRKMAGACSIPRHSCPRRSRLRRILYSGR